MKWRVEQAQPFLAAAGWGDARQDPLAGDASNRKYLRLTRNGGKTAVLMDADPALGEDVEPFARIAAHLSGLGLSAPGVIAADLPAGFLLLEDLGDDLFGRVCTRDPGSETGLYEAAVDLLVWLGTAPLPDGLRPYDTDVLQREAALLTDWYMPGAGVTLSDPARADYLARVAAATAPFAAPQVLVLRDYHADNLVWLPSRAGIARVGLLDFQDALAGHPAYDLVSLLEDARRDTPAELREEMMERFAVATGVAKAEVIAACSALGAQRNLKIVGIFARLALRDGKPGYLGLIPRVWVHLMRDLSHPGLGALADWVHANVPEPTPAVLAKIAEGSP